MVKLQNARHSEMGGLFPILVAFVVMAVLTVLSAPSAAANDLYLAQNSTGAANGADCADALVYSFFNNSGNWGSGSNQIGPGTTVHVCGTINTGVSTNAFTFQGSGKSGAPITLLFETGAIVQSPAFGVRGSAAINLNNQSNITVNGATNGQIQNTANGTSGQSNCPAGACTHQQAADLIYLDCGSNCEVKNLQLGPNYVRTGNNDPTACGFSDDGAVFADNSGFSNLLVDNNTIHDGHWLIQLQIGSGSNLQFFNNSIATGDHLIAVGVAAGASLSGFAIYDNIFGDMASWDDTSGGCHHDSIHIFTQSANRSGAISSLYIYNNQFNGPAGGDITCHVYLEPNGWAGEITNAYVFNNVLKWAATDPGGVGNGVLGMFAGSTLFIANNTSDGNPGNTTGVSYGVQVISAGQESGTAADLHSVTFENNIVTTFAQNMQYGYQSPSTLTWVSGQPDYNLYANDSSNTFNCNGNFYNYNQFSSWQSCVGNETHSSYVSSAGLSATDTLASGSPAIGTGKNLYTFAGCSSPTVPGLGALCYGKPVTIGPGSGATVGTARSNSAAWDLGAYVSDMSVSQPTPPSDLIATVN